MGEQFRQIANLSVVREVRRIGRFGLVGASGVIINSVILWLLADGLGVHYLLAGLVSYETALLSNFALNHRWTFAASPNQLSAPAALLKYHAVCVGGLCLTLAILALLRERFGIYHLVANAIAIAIAAAWNYGGSRLWAWRGAGQVKLRSAP